MRNLPRQEGRDSVLDSGDSKKQGKDIQTGSRCGVPHVGELLTSIYEDLPCAGNDPIPSSLLGETLALFADEDHEDGGELVPWAHSVANICMEMFKHV